MISSLIVGGSQSPPAHSASHCNNVGRLVVVLNRERGLARRPHKIGVGQNQRSNHRFIESDRVVLDWCDCNFLGSVASTDCDLVRKRLVIRTGDCCASGLVKNGQVGTGGAGSEDGKRTRRPVLGCYRCGSLNGHGGVRANGERVITDIDGAAVGHLVGGGGVGGESGAAGRAAVGVEQLAEVPAAGWIIE